MQNFENTERRKRQTDSETRTKGQAGKHQQASNKRQPHGAFAHAGNTGYDHQ